jgi:hypothetical protein
VLNLDFSCYPILNRKTIEAAQVRPTVIRLATDKGCDNDGRHGNESEFHGFTQPRCDPPDGLDEC